MAPLFVSVSRVLVVLDSGSLLLTSDSEVRCIGSGVSMEIDVNVTVNVNGGVVDGLALLHRALAAGLAVTLEWTIQVFGSGCHNQYDVTSSPSVSYFSHGMYVRRRAPDSGQLAIGIE